MKRMTMAVFTLVAAWILIGCMAPLKNVASPPKPSVPATSAQMSPTPVPTPTTPKLTASQKNLFLQFLNRFVRDFHEPDSDMQAMLEENGGAKYLCMETFYRLQMEGNPLQSGEDGYYTVPEGEIRRTAKVYLGIADLDVQNLTGWPIKPPEDGDVQFSSETHLQYYDVNIKEIALKNNVITADVTIGPAEDNVIDLEEPVDLIYTFKLIVDGSNTYFQFIAIAEKA